MSNQISLNLELNNELQENFRGAFIGAAIGDALGFITEFMRSQQDIRAQYHVDKLDKLVKWERITTYRQKGKYIKLPLLSGTYSDDTQLTLATARSIEPDGCFNPTTFAKFELPLWLEYELGGGSGTKAAARNLFQDKIEWHNNFYSTSYNNYVNGGGNGAAMRILPIALINLDNSLRRYLDIWRNTIITHGHPRALIAAFLLADAIKEIIKKPKNKQDWLDNLIKICADSYPSLTNILIKEDEYFVTWKQKWDEISKENFESAWSNICQETLHKLELVRDTLNSTKSIPLKETLSKLGCFNKETKGAGNSTVIAAILFIYKYTNFNYDNIDSQFEEVVVIIANLIGIDTDTIAYFAGAMIGAQYGIKAIPDKFKKEIQDYDYLIQTADWCHNLYSQQKKINKIFSYSESINTHELQNVKSLFDSSYINNAQATMPVFGNAKVLNETEITPENWSKDKRLYWLTIQLEFGQTIFFKIENCASIFSSQAKNIPNHRPVNSTSDTPPSYPVNSLPVLDEFKTKVENSNFDSEVILNIFTELKFERKSKAIYSAFTTWLWSALPSNK